jgi:xanthine dehydrogenase molybdenum-binding subunit
MACATHGNGYFDAFQDYLTLYMRLDEDGRVLLNAGFHDQGCGTITTMKQIVGEVLDLPLEHIRIPEVDTQMSPFDSAGTQASRVTYVCGKGAMLASEELKTIFIDKISVVYKTPANQIQLVGGKVILNNEKEISYSDAVAYIQTKLNEDISTTFKYKSISNPAVYAVNFAEVEIDTCTGLVRVTDVLAVHDIGQAINRGFVEGQVQGAIQMGIGFALTEEIEVGNKGKIKGDTFAKYHVVNAPDMPLVKVELVEAPDAQGPFGAKSVGEISACAIAPAIVNAIEHGLGAEIDALPATPERIMKALKKGR